MEYNTHKMVSQDSGVYSPSCMMMMENKEHFVSSSSAPCEYKTPTSGGVREGSTKSLSSRREINQYRTNSSRTPRNRKVSECSSGLGSMDESRESLFIKGMNEQIRKLSENYPIINEVR